MYVYEAVYVLAVPELNGLLILMERKLHPESRCQFLKKMGEKFSIMTFYDYLQFLYSEKAQKI